MNILLSLFRVKSKKEVSAGLVAMPGTQLRKQGTADWQIEIQSAYCSDVVKAILRLLLLLSFLQ